MNELLTWLEPFGEPACEAELQILGANEYRQYYFFHTHFNRDALNPKTFLIVGRRGTGKTALSHFFSFQSILPKTTAIDIDEPAAFQQVMTKLTSGVTESREIAIPRIAKVWEFVIWSLIFRELQSRDPRIRAACTFAEDAGKVSTFVRSVLKALMTKYLQTEDSLAEGLEALISDQTFEKAKKAVLELAKTESIVVAFDTLENYSLSDESMVRSTAALIQCASDFNREYAQHNLHIKLFLMAEIFPYLKEEAVLNTLKVVRDEVYLHWRPKELLKLICWRFWKYLKQRNLLHPAAVTVNWDDHQDVFSRIWEPYFGQILENGNGLSERTFPYILRHTQMRPRQLIVLCNAIAKHAMAANRFPYFTAEDLMVGIREGEGILAEEVFNSYASLYPNAARIADALSGLPPIFEGKELDRRAKETASQWVMGDYSLYGFRQLVTELGIIGRVRSMSESVGIVEADFEYARQGRLPVLTSDLCVIHPMFYQKLNIKMTQPLRIYPFPDHQEFKELHYR